MGQVASLTAAAAGHRLQVLVRMAWCRCTTLHGAVAHTLRAAHVVAAAGVPCGASRCTVGLA
eukprot:3233383-Alexandrium_andersonii.AAC.1